MVDSVAATLKAQFAAVASTEDCYTKGTREDNPDDLVERTGPLLWERQDVSLQTGTQLFHQVLSLLNFLELAATAESYATIDALLSGRCLRIPRVFNTLAHYPKYQTNLTNLFEDDAVDFGTFAHGGSFVGGDDLSTDVAAAWGTIVVGTGGIGGATWNLSVAVTYEDATTGTEAVAVTNGSAEGAVFDIGSKSITALSKLGQKVVGMSSTAGMVAGQTVLINDPLYASLLTDDADSAQDIIYVDPSQAGSFRAGDAVTVRDSGSNENATVLSIDYELGKITLSASLSNSYTTANSAFVYLQSATGIALRPPRQEYHTIYSVQSNTSITLVENLVHSCYVGASAIRLITGITGITTTSGGTTGDDIIARSKIERVPTQ